MRVPVNVFLLSPFSLTGGPARNRCTRLLINDQLEAFGFLASKEVKQAGVGNLGLRDRE